MVNFRLDGWHDLAVPLCAMTAALIATTFAVGGTWWKNGDHGATLWKSSLIVAVDFAPELLQSDARRLGDVQACPFWVVDALEFCDRRNTIGACFNRDEPKSLVLCVNQDNFTSFICPTHLPTKCSFQTRLANLTLSPPADSIALTLAPAVTEPLAPSIPAHTPSSTPTVSSATTPTPTTQDAVDNGDWLWQFVESRDKTVRQGGRANELAAESTDMYLSDIINREIARMLQEGEGEGEGAEAYTIAPTAAPIPATPIIAPTFAPTLSPTVGHTASTTLSPTWMPTSAPTVANTADSTSTHTATPTTTPAGAPTITPTSNPTVAPTLSPTNTINFPHSPTAMPTSKPTVDNAMNTTWPSTLMPTSAPTEAPTVAPTYSTEVPTESPTNELTIVPTVSNTVAPTMMLTPASATPSPTSTPTIVPAITRTSEPTANPTATPTAILMTMMFTAKIRIGNVTTFDQDTYVQSVKNLTGVNCRVELAVSFKVTVAYRFEAFVTEVQIKKAIAESAGVAESAVSVTIATSRRLQAFRRLATTVEATVETADANDVAAISAKVSNATEVQESLQGQGVSAVALVVSEAEHSLDVDTRITTSEDDHFVLPTIEALDSKLTEDLGMNIVITNVTSTAPTETLAPTTTPTQAPTPQPTSTPTRAPTVSTTLPPLPSYPVSLTLSGFVVHPEYDGVYYRQKGELNGAPVYQKGNLYLAKPATDDGVWWFDDDLVDVDKTHLAVADGIWADCSSVSLGTPSMAMEAEWNCFEWNDATHRWVAVDLLARTGPMQSATPSPTIVSGTSATPPPTPPIPKNGNPPSTPSPPTASSDSTPSNPSPTPGSNLLASTKTFETISWDDICRLPGLSEHISNVCSALPYLRSFAILAVGFAILSLAAIGCELYARFAIFSPQQRKAGQRCALFSRVFADAFVLVCASSALALSFYILQELPLQTPAVGMMGTGVAAAAAAVSLVFLFGTRIVEKKSSRCPFENGTYPEATEVAPIACIPPLAPDLVMETPAHPVAPQSMQIQIDVVQKLNVNTPVPKDAFGIDGPPCNATQSASKPIVAQHSAQMSAINSDSQRQPHMQTTATDFGIDGPQKFVQSATNSHSSAPSFGLKGTQARYPSLLSPPIDDKRDDFGLSRSNPLCGGQSNLHDVHIDIDAYVEGNIQPAPLIDNAFQHHALQQPDTRVSHRPPEQWPAQMGNPNPMLHHATSSIANNFGSSTMMPPRPNGGDIMMMP